MNLVSDDYNVVEKDLLTALDIINKSDDVDEILTAYIGIEGFWHEIGFISELGKVTKKRNSILKKTNKLAFASNTCNLYGYMADKNANRNADYYYNIILEQSKIIGKTMSSIKVDDRFTTLNDDYMYNILHEYLSKNDLGLLELLNKYVQKKTILNVKFSFYLGMCTSVCDNTYIKIEKNHSFRELITILHEISHAKINEEIVKPKGNKAFNEFYYTNHYLEVYPRLQERYFLQFLLDNNILVEDAKKYLVNRLEYFNELLLLSIKSYQKCKNVPTWVVKNLNSLLYRDLLFFNGTSITSSKSMENTIKEDFYLNNFGINDISNAVSVECDEIKRLVK